MVEKPVRRRSPVWLWICLGLAGVLAALIVAASLFNWNMARGLVGREVSVLAGRTVVIRGNLKVRLLSWTPGATADDVTVGSTPGVVGGDLAHIGRFAIQIKLLPLLIGRVELPLVEFEQPRIWAYRNAQGLSNWRAKDANAKPTKLPPIQRFVIDNGQLQLTDQVRKMQLTAALQSSETLNGTGRGMFQLVGRGMLNREPFSLALGGGPLLEVRANQPYAFHADLRSGQTHIVAQGQLPHPFDLGQLSAALTVSGANLGDLYYLNGVALPNTPAYHLAGDLVRDGQTFSFTHVSGVVGRSDLEGDFQVSRDGTRPKLTANLRSRLLDLADLAAITGAPAHGAMAQPVKAAVATGGQARRLLPDATLDVSRVRSTDAVLRYQADAVIARPGLPLRRFKLDLTLDHGVMTADPITFGFPQGQLSGKIRIDARTTTPHDAVDLRVTNVRLQDFLGRPGAPSPVDGTVEARAQLTGEGASVHQVAATADGEVTFVAPRGQVRQSIAELLGVDVTKGLGLLLTHNQSQIGLRCAVADFHADHGLLTARQLVFDSDAVLVKGSGTVNLSDEQLNLILKGQPKSFRLVRLNAPITVAGPLSGPRIGVQAGGAAAQAGTAVALGLLLTPMAAVLPFVDEGLAHDADCVGAISHAQTQGVPVKASATTPTGAKAAAPGAAKRKTKR